MEKLSLNEIRSKFIEFFESKAHYPLPSASLIPKDDKSLLIINSGMAPLKPYFAGTETPPAKRVTTCQKCVRTGDIDNVGKTARHGTFFEMLGNFSFGDYFKKESLTWGYEFLIDWLKMPKEKLWVTVYEDDDEAYNLWLELGMPEERIVKLGKEDNFWEIGLGPCGPCSEIYYDKGEKFGCGNKDCKPGCDCDRYIEFWNHVFTQFSKNEDGTYSNLAHPNIDTGMGLERIASIMQGVDSIFDIDTIKYILNKITEISGASYETGNEQNDISIRIITDHLRSIVFMICDGIQPGNEGRGYVLRRLIRRASRHGRLLGITESCFLSKLADSVVHVSSNAYPELKEKENYIKKIIKIEENKFEKTLYRGLEILEKYISDIEEDGHLILDGERVFKLYDTYGFPVEMTEEILKERNKNIEIDIDGFTAYMDNQKTLARKGKRDTSDDAWKDSAEYIDLPKTRFLGYETLESEAEILYASGYGSSGSLIIVDKTPFYATGGGQVHDIGVIKIDNEIFKVIDVIKDNDIFLHILETKINTNDLVGKSAFLKVDHINRHRTARGHSATHLLQKALKDVLGDHVMQAGSYVDDNYLRFDFNHYEPLKEEELIKIEKIVNNQIDNFLSVNTNIMDIKSAKESGATAIFGEKYGNSVRVVSMGDFSKELCGGTHVNNTGEIGAFKIISESGISSGVRRIEAITGTNVYEYLKNSDEVISELANSLKTDKNNLLQRVNNLKSDNKELEKTLKSLKSSKLSASVDDIIKEGETINGINLILKEFENVDIEDLRTISDNIHSNSENSIVCFASKNEGKVILLVSINERLVGKGFHSGKLIKDMAKAVGGGGGGKATMAQAGGKDAGKIKSAFEIARKKILEHNN